MLSDRILSERVEKYLSPIYWSDVNLTSVLHHPTTIPIQNLQVYEPASIHDRPNIQTILQNQNELFTPSSIGTNFTPSWSTKWFKFEINLSLYQNELKKNQIALYWDSNSEAVVYNSNGEHIQAFTGGGGHDRRYICILSLDNIITNENLKNDNQIFFVEMACNEMFGNGHNGMIKPPNPSKIFTLSDIKFVILNSDANDLFWDLTVMLDLVKSLPPTNPTHRLLLRLMNEIINTTNLSNQQSLHNSHLLALNFFNSNNNCKINHDIYAFGHCHIDTAWLWPYAETRRKVARSWATQLHLLKTYPQYHFVASQTVQYEWLLNDHPQLFQKIQSAVHEAGNFIPVGGTYVEFDANLPSGESMIRQFLYGTKFLQDYFQIQTKTFWLPDTFGYSSQLPQIMRGFEMKYFLSQKLSWNLINKFPHNTLEWRGIDGSAVIAHFPADNYESEANPSDLIKTVENNKSKMASNRSILLFGHGDGGGGPAISHFEKLNRLEGCESIARIHLSSTPDKFFEEVEKDFQQSRENNRSVPHPIWRGELYLELHQGTFTSQAKIKLQNRQCEMLLRTLESLHVFALLGIHREDLQLTDSGKTYISSLSKIIVELWKDTLLNQFHDVIPGSSIAVVYEDSDRMLSHVITASQEHIHNLMNIFQCHSTDPYWLFNSSSISRTHYLQNSDDNNNTEEPKTVHLNSFAFQGVSHPVLNDLIAIVDPIPSSVSTLLPSPSRPPLPQQDHTKGLYFSSDLNQYLLGNQFVEITLSHQGCILSFLDKRTHPSRQILHLNEENGQLSRGNNLMIYEDIPFYWDAWDVMPYHLMTGKSINDSQHPHFIQSVESTTSIQHITSHEVSLEFIFSRWGHQNSKIQMKITLFKDSPLLSCQISVDWHESHKLLKVEFPLSIHSNLVRYETQFGYTERPTHTNNATDSAMFETCGHRYATLSEPGYGVTLFNNCKYGHSCHGNTLCLSLLRAPKSPDPNCDMGRHEITYGILPHLGSLQEIQTGAMVTSQGILFNSPVFMTPRSEVNAHINSASTAFIRQLQRGIFSVPKNSNLILDSMKVAEEMCAGNGNVEKGEGGGLRIILRLYESVGARGVCPLYCLIPPKRASYTTLAETKDLGELRGEEGQGHEGEGQGEGKGEVVRTTFQISYKPFQIISIKLEY